MCRLSFLDEIYDRERQQPAHHERMQDGCPRQDGPSLHQRVQYREQIVAWSLRSKMSMHGLTPDAYKTQAKLPPPMAPKPPKGSTPNSKQRRLKKLKSE
jgi:hypothetical protein